MRPLDVKFCFFGVIILDGKRKKERNNEPIFVDYSNQLLQAVDFQNKTQNFQKKF
jgi:hypothetical protein